MHTNYGFECGNSWRHFFEFIDFVETSKRLKSSIEDLLLSPWLSHGWFKTWAMLQSNTIQWIRQHSPLLGLCIAQQLYMFCMLVILSWTCCYVLCSTHLHRKNIPLSLILYKISHGKNVLLLRATFMSTQRRRWMLFWDKHKIEDNTTKNSKHIFFCSCHDSNDFDPVATLLNCSALVTFWNCFRMNSAATQKLAQFSLIDAFQYKILSWKKKCAHNDKIYWTKHLRWNSLTSRFFLLNLSLNLFSLGVFLFDFF